MPETSAAASSSIRSTVSPAVRQGASCDVMFQSIAATEGANRNFGDSDSLLDEAYDHALRQGTARGSGSSSRRRAASSSAK